MKNLFIIIGIITIFAGYGCKKDKPTEPVKKIESFQEMSNTTTTFLNWLAYELMVPINDTLWPLNSNGFPYREINPLSGLWNIVGIKTYEVSVSDQQTKAAFECSSILVQERSNTSQIFNDFPKIKLEFYVDFAGSDKVIERVTDKGKFSDITGELNLVREKLVANPSKVLTEIIEEIYKAYQPIWLQSCNDYLVYRILHPQDPSKKAMSDNEFKKSSKESINEDEFNKSLERSLELCKKSQEMYEESVRNK